MLIDRESAKLFISSYSLLLAEAHQLSGAPAEPELLKMLGAGRRAFLDAPSLLEEAKQELEARGTKVSAEVFHAVRCLRVEQWVYLRDTSTYSVLLNAEGSEAYGVLGLTQRLREVLGSSGVTLRCGVVPFRGKYVCDGLVENLHWLGRNYKQDYAERLAVLRQRGKFNVACTA